MCPLPLHLKQTPIFDFHASGLTGGGTVVDTVDVKLTGVGVDLDRNVSFLAVAFLCSFSSFNKAN